MLCLPAVVGFCSVCKQDSKWAHSLEGGESILNWPLPCGLFMANEIVDECKHAIYFLTDEETKPEFQ